MAKKRPTPNEQAKLREKLIVAEFLEAHEARDNKTIRVAPVQALVDHVLADDHPGDDVMEPQWLINFAHNAFSHQKMRARLSDDAPVPLADIARECVNARDDEILSWGATAFREFRWQDDSRGSPLSIEQLCMIICLVGLTPHPAEHLAAGHDPKLLKGRKIFRKKEDNDGP
jgi:hypothetical protein